MPYSSALGMVQNIPILLPKGTGISLQHKIITESWLYPIKSEAKKVQNMWIVSLITANFQVKDWNLSFPR